MLLGARVPWVRGCIRPVADALLRRGGRSAKRYTNLGRDVLPVGGVLGIAWSPGHPGLLVRRATWVLPDPPNREPQKAPSDALGCPRIAFRLPPHPILPRKTDRRAFLRG